MAEDIKPTVPESGPHNNNEGRVTLTLASGRKAVLIPYDAYCAEAIGDQALLEEGTAYDKAVAGLLEAIDGKPVPNFEKDREGALDAVRDLLLNDYHEILFIAAASFRDGVFEGEFPDRDESTFFARIPLLNKDGTPLDKFTPDPYPKGTDKKYEWSEDLPGIGEVTFRFDLLDGHARARMLENGVTNLNADLVSRLPRYKLPGNDKVWTRYEPKTRPPLAVSQALTRKTKEIDPLIQYIVTARNPKGQKVSQSLMAVPDFFLQGFI